MKPLCSEVKIYSVRLKIDLQDSVGPVEKICSGSCIKAVFKISLLIRPTRKMWWLCWHIKMTLRQLL